MKLKSHVFASIVFSTLFFMVFRSWKISVSSFLSGVLIDIDHIMDYYREYGINLRIKQFFKVCHNQKLSRTWLIFHSWELLAILSICASLMSWDPWIVGLTIGFAQHIVLDQIFNKTNRLTYFFFWRMKNRFNLKKIFPN
ncbi:MAG: hypothetical protein HON76_09865 [Candidatus Scalindua sp.]|jgi:hypothetical protein|nr:hypothetical protein [Candidatus Scalindua sp.]MBT6231737.1 hypothetical protein [Candidatus Scalindua sp.]MBT6562819.1 hypothetical protein [Candidatus Scalindua sp.]